MMPMRALAVAVLLAVLSVPLLAGAEERPKNSALRAAKALDAIRGDPLALYAFLKRMPKGADLHNHLDGAVYAETFIRVGGEDGLCVDPVAKSFTKSQPIKSGAEPEPVCEAGDVRAADLPKNQRLYDELVDSFSRRGFVPWRARPSTIISSVRSPSSAARTRAIPARFSTRSRRGPRRRTSNILS
jgi:adenosine deaminase